MARRKQPRKTRSERRAEKRQQTLLRKLPAVAETVSLEITLRVHAGHPPPYHVTEAILSCGVMAAYLYLPGHPATAAQCYQLMHDLLPEHPATRQLGSLLTPEILAALLAAAQE